MRPRTIEVANVLGKHREQVALAQDDHVIETFTPHATEEALACGIHVWRAHRSLDAPRPEGSSSAVEVDAELVVPIANNETRSLAERRAVAELLRCPLL